DGPRVAHQLADVDRGQHHDPSAPAAAPRALPPAASCSSYRSVGVAASAGGDPSACPAAVAGGRRPSRPPPPWAKVFAALRAVPCVSSRILRSAISNWASFAST